MSVYEEYKKFWDEAIRKYKIKVALLMQVGDFWEIYGKMEEWGNVMDISQLLHIKYYNKDKANKDLIGCGFPMCSEQDYIETLLHHGYIVVLARQIKEGVEEEKKKKQKKTREISQVISPGTNLYALQSSIHLYLVCIYCKVESSKKNMDIISISLSAIDVSTGETLVYFIGNTVEDEDIAYNEVFRILKTLQVNEILIYIQEKTQNIQEKKRSKGYLVQYWELQETRVHYFQNEIPKESFQLSYQETFFKKMFPHTGLLSGIEYMELEQYPSLLVSFLLLLNFCYQQNESYVKHISKPKRLEKDTILRLDNNAIVQLSILDSTQKHRNDHLYNLVNHASTMMGKRLLKERLLGPIFDTEELEKRYDLVDLFRTKIEKTEEIAETIGKSKYFSQKKPAQKYVYEIVEKHLQGVKDMERLFRSMHSYSNALSLSSLISTFVCFFDSLQKSYQCMQELSLQTKSIEKMTLIEIQEKTKVCIDWILTLVEISNGEKEECTFRKGCFLEIDQLNREIEECKEFFENLAEHMNKMLMMQQNAKEKAKQVYVEQTATEGYYLSLTNKRWEKFQSLYQSSQIPMNIFTSSANASAEEKRMWVVDPKEFQVSKQKNDCKLKSPLLQAVSHRWIELLQKKQNSLEKLYGSFVSELCQRFSTDIKECIRLISLIDLYKSCAKSSLLYNYTRPQLLKAKEEKSFVTAKKLRHALVERYEENLQSYVAQDIDLREKNGMLLFGMNCAGKSIVMKALALAIVSAQSGMFVPAEHFLLSPYHSILTRITVEDDMKKGKSSYGVEMSEIRGILQRANEHSLVLADELVRSTEQYSAVSILSSMICHLSERQSSFLLTTHYHQLMQLDCVTNLRQRNLQVRHIKVRTHPDGTIVYERIIEDGEGDTNYGLEVARALGLDSTFLDRANEVRRHLLEKNEHFLEETSSRYNKRVYMDHCGIPNCQRKAEETHHIQFQSTADELGFMESNGAYVHHKSNLVPLCEFHHGEVHHGRLHIYGYKTTSQGIQLDYHIK